MEIELVEIRDFLSDHAPFSILTRAALDVVPADIRIAYARRGTAFPPDNQTDSALYVIRSGAIELRDSQGRLKEKLAEGDICSTECQTPDIARQLNGTAVEDSLVYLMSCRALKRLRAANPDFDRYFNDSLRERLRETLGRGTKDTVDVVSYMTTEVRDLVKKPPVTVSDESSIQQAAQIMDRNRVSSILVMKEHRLIGLITDRDLARHCVARGLPIDRPVTEIMTRGPEAVQHATLISEALMTMTRLSVHHLPVMDGDQPIGMITATDLARHQSTNPALIAAELRRSGSLDDLVEACRRLPDLQVQLAEANATALHTGEAIAGVTDALTCRLLELAEEEFGAPPVPYVWVAGGSQARHEQTSHSDQDNALILDHQFRPEYEPYFTTLADYVSDGLNACGFEYCPGDAMASNPMWRQPVKVWRKYFDRWIEKPEPKALMLASIFFDLRPVFGKKELFFELQREVLAKTGKNGIFIAYMAANALRHRPPLGFFRSFVLIHDGKHDATFDIKHRGIVPITDLARVYSLSGGLAPVNTTERLQAAVDSGALSQEMGANLEDALEFIASLRIRHQAAQIRSGDTADNFLPPAHLSSLERDHLKESFRVIQTMQDVFDSRFQAARFR